MSSNPLEQRRHRDGADTDTRHLQAVWAALETVIDPEVGLDIVSMGLVYDVQEEDQGVRVFHTLTTPRCPLGEVIGAAIDDAVSRVPGVAAVSRSLVWEPRWDPGMIRRDAW